MGVENLTPPGSDPHTLQSTASRYTDSAVPTPCTGCHYIYTVLITAKYSPVIEYIYI